MFNSLSANQYRNRPGDYPKNLSRCLAVATLLYQCLLLTSPSAFAVEADGASQPVQQCGRMPTVLSQNGVVPLRLNDEHYTPPALQIGGIRLTQDELKTALLPRIRSLQENGTSEADIKVAGEQAKAQLLRQAALSAYASENGYLQRDDLIIRLEAMDCDMIVGEHGILSKYLMESFNSVTAAEVAEKQRLSEVQYEFDWLVYSKDAALAKTPKQTHTVEAFEALAGNPHQGVDVQRGWKNRWPFGELTPFRDEILAMQLGQISPVLSHKDKVYILHLKSIESKGGGRFAMDDDMTRHTIRRLQKEDYLRRLDEQLIAMLKPVFAEDVLATFSERARQLKINSMPHNEPNLFEDIKHLTLVTYQSGEQRVQISVQDFLNYYASQPSHSSVHRSALLKERLYHTLFAPHYYRHAESLGLLSNPDYLSKRKLSALTLIAQEVIQGEIVAGIEITEQELALYYQTHQANFQGPAEAVASIFRFGSFFAAKSAFDQILTLKMSQAAPADTSASFHVKNIKDLKDYRLKASVSQDTISYPVEIVAQALMNQPGSITDPQKAGDDYYLIVKHQNKGTAALPFRFVKAQIRKLLSNQKVSNEINRLVTAEQRKTDTIG